MKREKPIVGRNLLVKIDSSVILQESDHIERVREALIRTLVCGFKIIWGLRKPPFLKWTKEYVLIDYLQSCKQDIDLNPLRFWLWSALGLEETLSLSHSFPRVLKFIDVTQSIRFVRWRNMKEPMKKHGSTPLRSVPYKDNRSTHIPLKDGKICKLN